jgi:hypothetical protein
MIPQGVSPTRKHFHADGAEQWDEYRHKDGSRGSQMAETKMPTRESGEFEIVVLCKSDVKSRPLGTLNRWIKDQLSSASLRRTFQRSQSIAIL